MSEKQKKVLVVEDEKPMAKALVLKLTKAGYDTQAAHDGEAALAKLREEHFDVMLLDLIMPKLDGFGVLEAMKAEGLKTPVIVSSNLGQENDQDRAKNLGAKDYFIKSDTPISGVIEHIKKVLG